MTARSGQCLSRGNRATCPRHVTISRHSVTACFGSVFIRGAREPTPGEAAPDALAGPGGMAVAVQSRAPACLALDCRETPGWLFQAGISKVVPGACRKLYGTGLMDPELKPFACLIPARFAGAKSRQRCAACEATRTAGNRDRGVPWP